MSLGVKEKDPSEVIDYVIEWGPRLDGDTISSVVTSVDPGLTKVAESNTDIATTVRIQGGTPGTKYKVESEVTTNDGEVLIEVFYVFVSER